MTRLRRIGATDAALGAWTAVALVFLFAPVVVGVLYAFNEGSGGKQTADFTGFTTRWFSDAWNDETLRSAVGVSLRVAVAATVLAVALGTATGIAMVRHPRRSVRGVLQALVYLLLIVPEVVLGVSLLLFYTKLRVDLGYGTLIAAHTVPTAAVVAIVVRSRVLAFDRSVEESALDLGAAPWQVVRDAVLPQLRPSLVGAGVLAFTFSLDNVVISQFLTTPLVGTLPVHVFGTLNYGTTPAAYAVVATLLAINLALLACAALIYRRTTR